ncbi:hypothetical protein J6590_059930, partial [Homalodisca vitripennis]
ATRTEYTKDKQDMRHPRCRDLFAGWQLSRWLQWLISGPYDSSSIPWVVSALTHSLLTRPTG